MSVDDSVENSTALWTVRLNLWRTPKASRMPTNSWRKSLAQVVGGA